MMNTRAGARGRVTPAHGAWWPKPVDLAELVGAAAAQDHACGRPASPSRPRRCAGAKPHRRECLAEAGVENRVRPCRAERSHRCTTHCSTAGCGSSPPATRERRDVRGRRLCARHRQAGGGRRHLGARRAQRAHRAGHRVVRWACRCCCWSARCRGRRTARACSRTAPRQRPCRSSRWARYITKGPPPRCPRPSALPHLLRRAISTTQSGRRGPALLTLPMDVDPGPGLAAARRRHGDRGARDRARAGR